MKMSSAPSIGAPESLILGLITQKRYFVPAKTRLGVPPKKHMKKKYEIFLKMYSNFLYNVEAFAHTIIF
jgi:hypothetical protein